MIVNFAAAMRRRSAFALCREYGISAAEVVPLLGLTEGQFLRALSPNKSEAAATQVKTFLGSVKASDFRIKNDLVSYRGNKDDWGYRRLVLHLAHLAVAAGGVETFIVGSELCGLTMIRDQSGFPFVNALCDLAGEVRGILGKDCKLTYGADWTEYFGHHPQDGSSDVFFHLDPLWAHPAINAVGIDNYMPLSDWRDEDYSVPNPDGFTSPYDLSGLQGQIASGEGFDWYYKSADNRALRTRTPITDGAGKPWVYRYKDLTSWWKNKHYNRQGGVESTVPTAWQPRGEAIMANGIRVPGRRQRPQSTECLPGHEIVRGRLSLFFRPWAKRSCAKPLPARAFQLLEQW